MKTLQQMAPSARYFIAAKDTTGHYWVMPWYEDRPNLFLWRRMTDKLFSNEHLTSTGIAPVLHLSRARTEKKYLELLDLDIDFWGQDLASAEVYEFQELLIDKRTCRLFIMEQPRMSSLGPSDMRVNRRKYTNGLSYATNERLRKEKRRSNW